MLAAIVAAVVGTEILKAFNDVQGVGITMSERCIFVRQLKVFRVRRDCGQGMSQQVPGETKKAQKRVRVHQTPVPKKNARLCFELLRNGRECSCMRITRKLKINELSRSWYSR